MSNPSLVVRATSEFVAITAGVLVALGVDSAWQARQDRAAEMEYLTSAVEELRTNARLIEYTVVGASEAHGRLERAVDILEADLVADSASVFLSELLTAISFRPSPQVSRSVVQDLVNSGNIGLVRDVQIRRSLVSADTWIATAIERIAAGDVSMSPGLERLVARHLPPGVTRVSSSIAFGGGTSIEAPPDQQVALEEAARRLAREPTLRDEIRVEFRRLEKGASASERLRRNLEGRAERLEARLAESDGST